MQTGKEFHGSCWANYNSLVGSLQVFLFQLSTVVNTLTHSARDTYSPPVYMYPWVDIPAFALW